VQEALIDECVVTRLATCVPVVTSPLPVVRATQFSWRTHKRLRGDAEGPLLAVIGYLLDSSSFNISAGTTPSGRSLLLSADGLKPVLS